MNRTAQEGGKESWYTDLKCENVVLTLNNISFDCFRGQDFNYYFAKSTQLQKDLLDEFIYNEANEALSFYLRTGPDKNFPVFLTINW